MSNNYYPAVSVGFLEVSRILKSMVSDPTYLASENCPYSDEVKEKIRGFYSTEIIITPEPVKTIKETVELNEDDELASTVYLMQEVQTLLTDLKNSGAKTSESASDQMGYFRTSTALIEKLVGMSERISSLRHYKDFTNLILEILEDICTPAQRTDFIERLREKAGAL